MISGKQDSIHTQDRLLGYQKALRDIILSMTRSLYAAETGQERSGYECVEKLLRQEVTAVFCMNDLMAGGVYDRADELGLRIPEDLSVVGYDNRELSSYYKPPLTTIELPLHDIGYRAAEVMMELLAGKIKTGIKELVYQVPCDRLIRQSVREIGSVENNEDGTS